MKLWRGLSRRGLAVSILSGLVGLISAVLLLWSVNRDAMSRSLGPLASYTFHEHERSRCEASPATFSLLIPPDTRYFAYDAETRRSANPAAPPLDAALLAQLAEGSEAPAVIENLGPFRGRKLLVRVAASGPCAVVQAVMLPGLRAGERAAVLLFGIVVVSSLTAALGFLAVFRPLSQRVERLRRAAERVGDTEGYARAEHGPGDELTLVGTSLDRAHARIRADARRLEQRQIDLERRLAEMMHDLRTPLSSLQIGLEQVADAGAGAAVNDLVNGALADAVYLAALVNNLRVATQLREGWDLLADDPRVDLAELLDRVARRVGIFARRRGVALEIALPDAPVFSSCHPIAAEQAISNVVENAVAHGDPGGHVAVLLAEDAGRFTLVVRDDGPGVPPADLPRLEERLFRTDAARQRDPRGSGLGLAITAEVCARCQWELSFAAEAPRGLSVSIAGTTTDGALPRVRHGQRSR